MLLTLPSTFFSEAESIIDQFHEMFKNVECPNDFRIAAEALEIMYNQMLAELMLQENQQDDYCDELFG